MSYCLNIEQATARTAKNLGFLRNTYVPIAVPGDSDNPRVHKIGGKIPIIENHKTWNEPNYQMCWQLYVPSLPVEVRRILPDDMHNGMLAIRMDCCAKHSVLRTKCCFSTTPTSLSTISMNMLTPTSLSEYFRPHNKRNIICNGYKCCIDEVLKE